MSLLFPTSCILCGQTITDREAGLCTECRQQMESDSEVICAGRYRGSYRTALLRLKYAQQPCRLYPIAELMAQAWDWHHMPLPDVITCVPMNTWHKFRRGYNQSEEFAKYLSEKWGVPYTPLLRRKLLSHKQSRLSAKQRQENAFRSFAMKKEVDLSGQHVLLVDDIVTTGATVSSCARLLRECKPESIWVLAAAKA